MKTLIVHAHPEPTSLNGALKDLAVSTLQGAGHEVRVSDLYAMNWKAVVDAADYGTDGSRRLEVVRDSGRAFDTGTLTPDVRAEQEKLLWADTIVLQFPLWWYSMPAILKGWVDRVFTRNFAYGVGEHSEIRYGDRYGEGTLAGRRALLSVTVGGHESHYSARGIDFDAVRKPTRSRGVAEYGVSKLANVLFSAELARKLTGTGVTTYSLHPGVVASDIWRSLPWPIRPIAKAFMLSNEEGAATTLYCATSEQAAGETGLYYDKARVKTPSPLAQDRALAARLWAQSEAWIQA